MRQLLSVMLMTLWTANAFAAFDSADSAAAQGRPLEIIRVTPDGEDVEAGKQIVVQFNRPVVPLGRMERSAAELPIIMTPALPCEWRWINTSALACNLPEEQPLVVSSRYRIEIKPGIQAEDGQTTEDTYVHNFITARPRLLYREFWQWKSPGLPVSRLVFDQPVDKESLEQHVFLSVGDDGRRVALSARPDPDDQTLPSFLPAPGEPYSVVLPKQEPRHSDDQLTTRHGKEARRIWLVEPNDELPIDTHVILKIEPGLRSALGPETSIDEREVAAFDTYPEFKFIGVECTTLAAVRVMTEAGADPKGKCDPMQAIELIFTAPVSQDQFSNALYAKPAIGWRKPKNNDDEEAEGDEESSGKISWVYRQTHTKGRNYALYLPYGLKAAQDYSLASASEEMNIFERIWHFIKSLFVKQPPIAPQDIFGRPLANPLSAHFTTDHRSPNYVLDYSDAVLEKNTDSDVPFYVNNLNAYGFDFTRVTAAGKVKNQHFYQSLPDVKDIQYAVPFGVRSMLNGKTGAVFGWLNTTPHIKRYRQPSLFAQVTPYQVHMKLGHYNSIAWVTDMASGQPVSGAQISLYSDIVTQLDGPDSKAQTAVTDASGIARLPGTETLDPDLSLTLNYGIEKPSYFVRVVKDGDMALLPLSYNYLINSYRASGNEAVYPSSLERYGHMRAWGTTAQGIYRAGDTMQYKVYVRNQDNKSFIAPPRNGYLLKIVDPMGKVVETRRNLTLSEFGALEGEFNIPKDGAVGWYQFQLYFDLAKTNQQYDSEEDADADTNADERGKKTFYPMRVLVSDFTPSPFKATNQLNGDKFGPEQKVSLDTHAELHSGGAYTDAGVRITAILDSAVYRSPHPLARDFQFDSFSDETSSQQLFRTETKLDDKGSVSVDFNTGTPRVFYGKLMVESAVADDRGKFVTSQARADYFGVDRLVGLRSNQWLFETGKPASVDYVVVDEKGDPVAGTSVELKVERQVSKSARVKGAGNAYLTEYHTEWKEAGECEGTSAAEPQRCEFTPKSAGSYRIVARIEDTKGRAHSTTYYGYASGGDYVSWDDGNDNGLTIIPERTDYKIGDTARYLVKNPYPGSQALITIERYGVLESFVQKFDGSTPVVEFKVKPEYMPGFYLSVTIFSPRVEKPLGKGQVDLGKPTFRMGYVTVPVTDPYKEVVVTANVDKQVYKPRDHVTVAIHAEPRVKDKSEPIELAVAVLDESVFDLVAGGKKNFDPYAGFYTLDNLDLRNYSLLTRLIGRQKFEKKGANPGGDGGSDLSMRSLFKFVSYWNGALKTDQNGNATIQFQAPDNLTGWRVIAIATTPSDRFGLGEGNFKVNRPTEVRPVMPNQVMEGDEFDAGFSVMNRTDKPREISVDIVAEGNIKSEKSPAILSRVVKLEPYKRTTVYMPIKTTAVEQRAEVKSGEVKFTVTAGDDSDIDGIVHTLSVHKRRSLEVAANYGTTTQDAVQESIAFPQGMLPDVGNVSVELSPTVIGNIAGAFRYIQSYPYFCWEQRLSKAVMASHYKNLRAYLPGDLSWKDSDTLPQQTLQEAASFQAPNGGMTYFVAQDVYVDPYLSAYTALAFNWLRQSGYTVPEEVEARLHSYLNNLLQNDAAPDFYSEGMTSTVRAVALAALAQNGKASLSDIERYAPHMKNMSLFGKSFFLQAATYVDGASQYAQQAAKAILASSNQTGGKFVFNETLDDSYARILSSPLRENCAVLDAFTRFGEQPAGAELVGDVPFKLVRSISQSRENRDHWETTQENLFCMNALVDFSRVYEKDAPAMRVTASMAGEPLGETAFNDLRNNPVTLTRPLKAGDAGNTAKLDIERNGSGRLYYATRLSYALPFEQTKSANAGIEIHREYSVKRDDEWVLLEPGDAIERGDVVRVDIYLSIPAARNFVVVDDPVPGGLEPINRDLATASEVDARDAEFKAAGGSLWFKYDDWTDFNVSRWSFYHQELCHDAARFYADYLPAGNYHLSYAAQAIATGDFSVLPSMAQEMYDTDVYGKTEAMKLPVRATETKQ